MSRILIVEDDPAVRDVVEYALSREGMETEAVGSGEGALECLGSENGYDLVVLDVMLPDTDGVTICRELRSGSSAHSCVPVVMLTVLDNETDMVVGLEVGADDYITKPFSPRELVSRVRAQLRRRELDARMPRQRLEFPGLAIDLASWEVMVGGEPTELTKKEFQVLALLATHSGEVYSRERIMDHLWDGEFFGEARAADVHIQHIRQKIELDPQKPRYIQTVRGAGYRFAQL